MRNCETRLHTASQDSDAEQRPGQTAPGSGDERGRGVFAADTIRDLYDMLSWLDDAEEYHQSRLESVKEDKKAVERVRLLHFQWQAESHDEEGDEIGAHAHISPRDIAHCQYIKDAYVEIACRSGGLLKCAETAKLLLAAGLSKSKSVSLLAGTTRKRLLADADWEHRGPGVFRYLPYSENGEKPSRPGSFSTVHVRSSPRLGAGAVPTSTFARGANSWPLSVSQRPRGPLMPTAVAAVAFDPKLSRSEAFHLSQNSPPGTP